MLNMPINVLGNRNSNKSDNKIDTSLFVQKPYLRSNYIETKIEEDIDLRNQYRIKNLPDPISIRETASKNYVDNKFNDSSIIKNTTHIDFNDKNLDNVHSIKVNSFPTLEEQLTPKIYVNQAITDGVNEPSLLRLEPQEKLNLDKQGSIVLNSTLTLPKTKIELPIKNYVNKKFNDPSLEKNTAHVDFKDKNLDNVRFVRVNSMPAVREHLTQKYYVDQAIFYNVDEASLLRSDLDEKLQLDEQDSIILKSTLTSPKTIIELPTKAYADSLQESRRNKRDFSSVFNDQDNEFDNYKLTNLDTVTVNRNPNLDIKLANKKYIDDELDKNTVLRFNQTLENYLKVSVGNDTYNLTKYDRIQITDTTNTKYPNTGGYLLQNWVIQCNDKNNTGKIQNFLKSTKTNSPTRSSGAKSLPPLGNSFMYLETSSKNHGNNVFVYSERADIFQISNLTFYYNRFSILTNDSLKAMGHFRFQLLLEDNTWSTRYNIAKSDRNSDTSTDWTLLSLNLTDEIYGIELIYDQIDTAHADMCFSNIMITHSVY